MYLEDNCIVKHTVLE